MSEYRDIYNKVVHSLKYCIVLNEFSQLVFDVFVEDYEPTPGLTVIETMFRLLKEPFFGPEEAMEMYFFKGKQTNLARNLVFANRELNNTENILFRKLFEESNWTALEGLCNKEMNDVDIDRPYKRPRLV